MRGQRPPARLSRQRDTPLPPGGYRDSAIRRPIPAGNSVYDVLTSDFPTLGYIIDIITIMSKSFFKYASLLFVLLPSAVYGQEVSSPDPVKTDLSDPDLIVRPPTDPYSLSFTPPMPEGAANITTQEHCKQAGGKWTTMKLAEADVQTEKLIGCITNGKRNGRWMVHDIETPPAEQTEEKALGYMWMIDDSVHGWSVMLDRETRTVIELAHFNMGVLDGTQFSWSNVGSLESVTT